MPSPSITSRPLTSAPPNLIVTEGRNPDVVAFEGAIVGFFLQSADLLGVPKSVAAIYGIVFASPEPLSFSEIEARLNISKGSISQGMRVLREVGALRAVKKLPDRRETFEPDLALRRLIRFWIDQRLEKQLDAGAGSLNVLLKMVPAGSSKQFNSTLEKEGRVLRDRLKSLKRWHGRGRALMPIVKAFLKAP